MNDDISFPLSRHCQDLSSPLHLVEHHVKRDEARIMILILRLIIVRVKYYWRESGANLVACSSLYSLHWILYTLHAFMVHVYGTHAQAFMVQTIVVLYGIGTRTVR